MHLGLLPLVLALGGPAQAATAVCGTIAASTTWTAAGSPYVVTCDTTVIPGVTLTVDPGVTVAFDPAVRLIVQGLLDVDGTSAQPVTLQRAVPTSPWGGLELRTNVGGHATLDWAVVDGATTGLSVECCWGHPVPAVLQDVVMTGHDTAVRGYAGNPVLIADSEFAFNGVAIAQADMFVQDSWIHDNTYGVALGPFGGGAERMTIEGTTIEDNVVGVVGGSSMTVQYALVQDNGTGLEMYGGIVRHNDIVSNGVGVRLGWSPLAAFTLNNLVGNTSWAVQHAGTALVAAPNNWWGSVAPAAIDAVILDVLDNPLLGLVDTTTPATGPVLTTYSPPAATALTWSWNPSVDLGVDLTCVATDDGFIASVAWTVSQGATTWTNTTPGLSWTFVAPASGVYDVTCRATDDVGLHASAASRFWVAADTDADGVMDDWDACPGTPVGTAVDDDGCPVTCTPTAYAAGSLTIPAVWMPTPATCTALTLTGPPSAMSIVGTAACAPNPCAPAAFYAGAQLLVLPTVQVGATAYTAVFQKTGTTFALLAAVPH